MTATEVDGRAVVADRAALSTLKDRAGNPVRFRQIRELLLDDGALTYGCVHCDYTNPNVLSVRPHLNRHRNDRRDAETPPPPEPVRHPAPKPEPRGASPEPKPTTPAPAVDRRAVTADRDYWRRRCAHAEALLDRITTALDDTDTTTPHLKGA